MDTKETIAERIESHIDTFGLAHLLDTIEHVCHQKAAHLSENWQDKTACAAWEKAAWAIRACAQGERVRRVSVAYEAS